MNKTPQWEATKGCWIRQNKDRKHPLVTAAKVSECNELWTKGDVNNPDICWKPEMKMQGQFCDPDWEQKQAEALLFGSWQYKKT